MKKLNITHLEKMISKVLNENLGEKAETLVSKIKSSIKENSEVCEQCGGNMNEGECTECGSRMMDEGIYDVEDINNKDEFDYVQEEEDVETETEAANEDACKYHMDTFGPEDERTKQFCGSSMNEGLKGRQRKLDKNKNNKIDSEDFKLLRKDKKEKSGNSMKFSDRHGMEEQETEEGNAFSGALADAKKSGKDSFEVDGKKYQVKEGKKFIQKAEKEIEKKGTKGDFAKHCGGTVTKSCIEKALKSGDPKLVKQANFAKNIKGYKGAEHKESVRMTESELINLIEKIISEQKFTKTKDVAEKNNLKTIGSAPGLEKYKQVHKKDGKENEDNLKAVAQKMKDYLKDGSKGEYDTNPKIFPKGNGELAKMSKKAYVPSGAVEEYVDNFTAAALENLDYDGISPNEEWVTSNIEGSSKTGNNPDWANTGESDVNKKRNKIRKDNLLGKLKRKAYNKAPQPVIDDKSGEDKGSEIMTKLESVNDKKSKQINEEFNRMKSLMSYNQKTQ